MAKPISKNTIDNEHNKFQNDSNGDVAINVISDQLVNATNPMLGDLVYDAGTVSYPNSVTEIYEFRQGGLAGLIVATTTIIYTNSTKQFMTSFITVKI